MGKYGSPPPHGSYRYRVWGCRCAVCTKGNSAKYAEDKARRSARLREDPTLAEHGKVSTYRNWSCRCEACTRVHVADVAEYKIRTNYEDRRRRSTSEDVMGPDSDHDESQGSEAQEQ